MQAPAASLGTKPTLWPRSRKAGLVFPPASGKIERKRDKDGQCAAISFVSCRKRNVLYIKVRSYYVTQGQGEDHQAVVITEFNQAGKNDTSAELDGMIESAREASDFLKAMSHETRLLILCFLAGGERSVSELEEFLSLKQSNVSQHLGRLRLDGLVKPRRDGQTIYYSLASEDVRKMLVTIHDIFCHREVHAGK